MYENWCFYIAITIFFTLYVRMGSLELLATRERAKIGPNKVSLSLLWIGYFIPATLSLLANQPPSYIGNVIRLYPLSLCMHGCVTLPCGP